MSIRGDRRGSVGGELRRAVFEALHQQGIGVNVNYLTEAEQDGVVAALREMLA